MPGAFSRAGSDPHRVIVLRRPNLRDTCGRPCFTPRVDTRRPAGRRRLHKHDHLKSAICETSRLLDATPNPNATGTGRAERSGPQRLPSPMYHTSGLGTAFGVRGADRHRGLIGVRLHEGRSCAPRAVGISPIFEIRRVTSLGGVRCDPGDLRSRIIANRRQRAETEEMTGSRATPFAFETAPELRDHTR
jgi:hypothetical protein